VALDGTFAKDVVKKAIEGAVAKALDLEAYRGPLAATISAWVREGPFQGLALREIRLQPAADGGLDLLAVTTSDPCGGTALRSRKPAPPPRVRS
jgi:hypothetical protein